MLDPTLYAIDLLSDGQVANAVNHGPMIEGENPDSFFFKSPGAKPEHPATNGDHPPYYGYHRLPDGTLTPLYNHLAMIATRDGTIYATIIYPFTLLKIDPPDAAK